MQVFVNEKALKKRLSFLKAKGKTIGFVPTMGALHNGHISLMQESKNQCDITVCSIFVNPTQFNNKEDLVKYPKTIDSDKKKLKDAGVDILFLPTERVVYPKNIDLTVNLNLDGIDKLWEGKFRPGHFKGVVQVVKRLLDMVEPDFLFMGQKDFQQFTIINIMLKKLRIKTKLVVVPIFREKDGLAMSSRNVRLTKEFRNKAVILNQMLQYVKENFNKIALKDLEQYALTNIKKKGLDPEYFKFVDGTNLEEITSSDVNSAIAIVAAWAGEIRLIDNIIIK